MTSASATSLPAPQESSHRDEFIMQQSLLLSDTLKDLKSLTKQLYSAAEYFEIANGKKEQKQIVEGTLKDYAIKALINTVDHLGSVAYKFNSFLDEKMSEFSGMELRSSFLEQRLRTCQEFVNLGGLSQQSLVLEAPKHHKRYIFPVEEALNDVVQTRLKFHRTSMFARLDLHQFKDIGIQATVANTTPSERVGYGFIASRSPQPLPRQGPQLFTSVLMNQRPGNRSTSPRHFPLPRIGSLIPRSTSPTYPNAKRRYPSEPRRNVSLSTMTERETGGDVEQYSSKSKRLFKAMLSLRKSKKDVTLYKLLDEN